LHIAECSQTPDYCIIAASSFFNVSFNGNPFLVSKSTSVVCVHARNRACNIYFFDFVNQNPHQRLPSILCGDLSASQQLDQMKFQNAFAARSLSLR
jgi:hypothetical protein